MPYFAQFLRKEKDLIEYRIANFFIELAHQKEVPLTPLKLQKLLYFAHGWHLALDDEHKPLLQEPIEAWKYGPVVPSVYHEFKKFRDNPITNYAQEDENRGYPKLSEKEIKELEPFLNQVWKVYAHLPAIRLSNLTHLQGTPWKKIYDKYEGNIPIGKIIDNKDIQTHFQDKMK